MLVQWTHVMTGVTAGIFNLVRVRITVQDSGVGLIVMGIPRAVTIRTGAAAVIGGSAAGRNQGAARSRARLQTRRCGMAVTTGVVVDITYNRLRIVHWVVLMTDRTRRSLLSYSIRLRMAAVWNIPVGVTIETTN